MVFISFNNFLKIFGAVALLLSVFTELKAGTGGGIYDMSRLLNEKHPFSKTTVSPRLPLDKPVARQIIPTVIIGSSQNEPTVNEIKSLPKFEKVETESNIKREEDNSYSSEGIFNEARVGWLVHDEGPFSRNKESGFDVNIELLFNSPDFLEVIWAPMPHVGATINSDENTSQSYAGLTWGWSFYENYFFNFSFGGSVHNGEKETANIRKKSLGCRFLFREALDLGYKIRGPHSIMFHMAHISNAKLCSTNEGLENFGIRYGYRF